METIKEREHRNDPELAQWYLESGSDDKWFSLTGIALSIGAPPLMIFGIPWTIFLLVRGCRKRGKGKRMNEAAGRENFERCSVGHSRFMPHTPLRHERYGLLSNRPPGHPDHYEIPSGGTAVADPVYHEGYYEVEVSSGGTSSMRS